jgi:hypothetical protein
MDESLNIRMRKLTNQRKEEEDRHLKAERDRVLAQK